MYFFYVPTQFKEIRDIALPVIKIRGISIQYTNYEVIVV